jgi:hypothetical protein
MAGWRIGAAVKGSGSLEPRQAARTLAARSPSKTGKSSAGVAQPSSLLESGRRLQVTAETGMCLAWQRRRPSLSWC